MILRKPDFYDKFKCIASRCTDTCCVGWEIDIDETSQEKYREVGGAFGEKLRQNIEDGHFKLLPRDRCPFLDRDNLCEIYRHLGEDALCDICREHPRFVEVYGDLMERGIGLCCEEAARLLLEGEGPLAFSFEETDEPEDELDDDREIRDEVLGERETMFETLADASIPFSERLRRVFGPTDGTAAPVCGQKIFELLSKTISYGPAWDEALDRIRASLDKATGETPIRDQGFFSENESVRLLAYLIYRHYAKALFDGRGQGKLQFALFFWNAARLFTRELAGSTPNPCDAGRLKVCAVKLLSKQLEYCEENMFQVESALDG